MNFVKKIMKTSWLVTKDTFWVTIFGMFISLIFTGITLYIMKQNHINGAKEDLCGPFTMIERFCDNDEDCINDMVITTGSDVAFELFLNVAKSIGIYFLLFDIYFRFPKETDVDKLNRILASEGITHLNFEKLQHLVNNIIMSEGHE